MSEDLQDLLAREGHEDIDTLMDWARERAAELVPKFDEDEELGPLLGAGGEAGAAPVRAESGTAAEAETLRVEQVALAARREASNAAPLPPIPVAVPADPTDELDLDEIEELDMEELEMVDDDDDDDDDGEALDDAQSDVAADSQEAADPDAAADPGDAESDVAGPEVNGPDDYAGGEPYEAADPSGAPHPSDEAAAESGEAVSFGPPDGNEHVPEWKAALLSTQTETDQEAAERVKEASTAGPLPQMEFPQDEDARRSGRLEAEDEEISQHSVDLSDLDADEE